MNSPLFPALQVIFDIIEQTAACLYMPIYLNLSIYIYIYIFLYKYDIIKSS